MPGDTQPTGLITYEEASALLDKRVQAVRSLVFRGELHTYPDPQDKRRRLLSLAEVQAYTVTRAFRGLPMPASSSLSIAGASSSPAPGMALNVSPQMLGALAGGIALIVLLLFILKNGSGDPALRVLIIGAIAGVALLVIAQWREEGRISAQEARSLERLAKNAEADPDKAESFITTLQSVIEASGATA